MLIKYLNKLLGFLNLKLINTKKQQLPVDFEKWIADIYLQVKPFTMTSPERIYANCTAIKWVMANNIQGSIVECGVWRGGSTMAMALTLLKLKEAVRVLYLYDTFEGMSEPSEQDKDFTGLSAKIIWEANQKENKNNWGYASIEDVKQNVSTTKYPADKIHYIKGKVEETMPSTLPESIAVLRLDTDWYESTYHELVHLFPLLAKGGILILDDYGHWEGQKKAVEKYFAENNIKMFLSRIDYTGRMGIKQ
jgi:O-methyltransferase